MTKDEALKKAIEQLWACSMLMNLDHSDYLYEDVIQALDACKEALAQPAQELVTCLDKMQSITEQEYYEGS
jgi:exonuclease VII small subunit